MARMDTEVADGHGGEVVTDWVRGGQGAAKLAAKLGDTTAILGGTETYRAFHLCRFYGDKCNVVILGETENPEFQDRCLKPLGRAIPLQVACCKLFDFHLDGPRMTMSGLASI